MNIQFGDVSTGGADEVVVMVPADDELEMHGAAVETEAAHGAGLLELHHETVDGGLVATGKGGKLAELSQSDGTVLGSHLREEGHEALGAAETTGAQLDDDVLRKLDGSTLGHV